MTRATHWPSLSPVGIVIEVWGEMVPYVRVGRERHTLRAESYHAWKRSFEADLIRQAKPTPYSDDDHGLPWLTGAIVVELEIFRYKQTGDIDNMIKSIFDAANGALWHDDAQITKSSAALVPCRKGEDRVVLDLMPDVLYAESLKATRRRTK